MSRHSAKWLVMLVAAMFLGLVATPNAQATDYIWQGTVDGLWATDGNWDAAGFPISTDTATLDDTGVAARPTVNLNGNQAVGTLTFANTGQHYVVTGGVGDILTISTKLAQTGYDATVAAGIATDTSALEAQVTKGTLTVSGAISGTAAGINKTGAGRLVLTGTNSFGGVGQALTLTDGILRTDKAAALGSTDNSIDLNGGTWQVAGMIYNSRPVNLGGAVTIDTSYASGAMNNTLFLNGAIGGTGSITKMGLGTLVLGTANTFQGGLTINDGMVKTMNSDALNPTTGGTVTVNNGGMLHIANPGAYYGGVYAPIDLRNVVVNAGGTLRLYADPGVSPGVSYAPTATVMGTFEVGGANMDYYRGLPGLTMGQGSTFAYVNTSNGRTWLPDITLEGDTTFYIPSQPLYLGNSGGGMLGQGGVSGAGGLIKTGGNTMELKGPATYTGATLVDGGTLSLRDYGVLSGTSSITVMSPGSRLLIDNGGSKMTDRVSQTVTLHAAGLDAYNNKDQTMIEIIPEVQVFGDSNIKARRESGNTSTHMDLVIENLVVNQGAKVDFSGDNLGGVTNSGRIFLNNINGSPTTLDDGILGGWAVSGSDFVKYDSILGVAKFTAYNTGSVADDPTANFAPGGASVLTSDANLNSLKLNNYNVTMAGAYTLNIESGGLIHASGTTGSTITGGFLTAGGTADGTLTIHATGSKTLTIASAIIDNAGPDGTLGNADDGIVTVAKSSSGAVTLTNAGNTYTGGTFIGYNGTVTAQSSTKTGNVLGTGAITMEAGTLYLKDNIAAATIDYGNDVNIINNAVIDVNRVDGSTFGKTINLGALTVDGGALAPGRVLRFTGSNNYSLAFTGTTLRGTLQPENSTNSTNPYKFGPTNILGPSKVNVTNSGGYADIAGLSGAGSLTKIGGGWLTISEASPTYAQDIIVNDGVLVAGKDGALGSGTTTVARPVGLTTVQPHLSITAAQTVFPTLNIGAWGVLDGNLANAVYSGGSQNVTLAENAIIGNASTGTLPTRADTGGATLWQGVDTNTDSLTVGDDGSRVYQGVSFTRFTQGGDFRGTLASDSGQDLNIYMAANKKLYPGASTDTLPAFNPATGIVNVYGPAMLEIAANGGQTVQGTWTTINRIGDVSTQRSSFLFNGLNALPADKVFNITNGRVLQYVDGSKDIQGTVNVGVGATLYLDKAPGGGTFNILEGGAIFANNQNRFGSLDATFNVAPGTFLLIDCDVDTAGTGWSTLVPQMDIVVHDNTTRKYTNGITLGQDRRFIGTTGADARLQDNNTTTNYDIVKAAVGATNVIFSEPAGRNMYIYKSINLGTSGVDTNLQIGEDGDIVAMSGISEGINLGMTRVETQATGQVNLVGTNATVAASTISIKSGTLRTTNGTAQLGAIPITMTGGRFLAQDTGTTAITLEINNPFTIPEGSVAELQVARGASGGTTTGNFNGLITLGGTLRVNQGGSANPPNFKGGIQLTGANSTILAGGGTTNITTIGITEDGTPRTLTFGDIYYPLLTLSQNTQTLSVQKASFYTGGTIANSGTLTGTIANAFGQGPVTVNGGTMNFTHAVDTNVDSPTSYTANAYGTLNIGHNATDGQKVVIAAGTTINANGGRVFINGRSADTATATTVAGTLNATNGGRIDIGANADDTKNRIDFSAATINVDGAYSMVAIRPRAGSDQVYTTANSGAITLTDGGGFFNGGARNMTVDRDFSHSGDWVLGSLNNDLSINANGDGLHEMISDTSGLILRATGGKVKYNRPILTIGDTHANGTVAVEPRGGQISFNETSGARIYTYEDNYVVHGWGKMGGNNDQNFIIPAAGMTYYADDSMAAERPWATGGNFQAPGAATLIIQGRLNQSSGGLAYLRIGDNDGIRMDASGTTATTPYVIVPGQLTADAQTQQGAVYDGSINNIGNYARIGPYSGYMLLNKDAIPIDVTGANKWQINFGGGTLTTDLAGTEDRLLAGTLPWLYGEPAPFYQPIALANGAVFITSAPTFTLKANEYVGGGNGTFLAPYGTQVTDLQADGLFDMSSGTNGQGYIAANILGTSTGVLRLDFAETTALLAGGDLSGMTLAYAGAPTNNNGGLLWPSTLRVNGANTTVTIGTGTGIDMTQFAPGANMYRNFQVSNGTMVVKTTNATNVSILGTNRLNVDRGAGLTELGAITLDGGTVRVEGSAPVTTTVIGGATLSGYGKYGVAGDTFINNGTVSATSGGTLEIAAATIDATGGGQWNYTGSTLLLNGEVVGAAYTLNANQAGTMILGKANSYGGNTIVSAGTLRVREDATLPAGGTVTVMGAAPVLAPGLIEGRLTGNGGDFVTPNPANHGTQLQPLLGTYTTKGAEASHLWGDTETWVYTGQYLSDGGNDTWLTDIDDTGWIMIDGVVWFGDAANHLLSATKAMGAGWHDIEIRVGNGTGNAGPTRGTPGVGLDLQGRGTTVKTDFIAPIDNGSMNMFRTYVENWATLLFEKGHGGQSWSIGSSLNLLDYGSIGAAVDEVATDETPFVNQINDTFAIPGATNIMLTADRGTAADVAGKVYFPNVTLADGANLYLKSMNNAGILADVDVTGTANVFSSHAVSGVFLGDVTGSGTLNLTGTQRIQMVGTLGTTVDMTNTSGVDLASTSFGAATKSFDLGGQILNLKSGINNVYVDPGTGIINLVETTGSLYIWLNADGALPSILDSTTINLANGRNIRARVGEVAVAPQLVNNIGATINISGTARLEADRNNDAALDGAVYYRNVNVADAATVELDRISGSCAADLTLTGATARVQNVGGGTTIFVGDVTGIPAGSILEYIGTNQMSFIGKITDADLSMTATNTAFLFDVSSTSLGTKFDLNGRIINQSTGNNIQLGGLKSGWVITGAANLDTTGIINQAGTVDLLSFADGSAGVAGWGSGLTINKTADTATTLRTADVAWGNTALENAFAGRINMNATGTLSADQNTGANIDGTSFFKDVHLADAVNAKLTSVNNTYLKANFVLDGATATLTNDSSDTRVLVNDVTGATTDLTLSGTAITHFTGAMDVQSATVTGRATFDAGSDVTGTTKVTINTAAVVNALAPIGGIYNIKTDGTLLIGDAGFAGTFDLGGGVDGRESGHIIVLGSQYAYADGGVDPNILIAIADYNQTLTLDNNATKLGATTTDLASIVAPIAGAATQVNLVGGTNLLTLGSATSGAILTGAKSVVIDRNMAFRSDNSYSLGTTINSGTTTVYAAAGLGSGDVALSNAGTRLVVRNAGFDLSAGKITVNTGATLDLYTAAAASIAFAGGDIEAHGNVTASGALTDGDVAAFLTNGNTLTFGSTLDMTAARTWTIETGTVAFNGNVTGNQDLIKAGNGTLRLNGAANAINSLTVGTSPGGYAVMGPDADIMPTTVTILMGSAYAVEQVDHLYGEVDTTLSTGVLALGASTDADLTFNNASLFLGAYNDSAYSGTLTPSGTQFMLGGGGGRLTVDTILADQGVLPTNVQVGWQSPGGNDPIARGSVLFNQTNLFTGDALIYGDAILGVATALDSAAAVKVYAGGSIDLNGHLTVDISKFNLQPDSMPGGGIASTGGTLSAGQMALLFPLYWDYIVGGAGIGNTNVADGALVNLDDGFGGIYQKNLIKVGSNQVTLLSTLGGGSLNNYGGGMTAIQGGTLTVPDLATLGLTSNLQVSNAGKFDVLQGGTFAGTISLSNTAKMSVAAGQTLVISGLDIGAAGGQTSLIGGGTLDLGTVAVTGSGAEFAIADTGTTLITRLTNGMADRAFRIGSGTTLNFATADAGDAKRIGWLMPGGTLKFGDGINATVTGHFGLTFDVAGLGDFSAETTNPYTVIVDGTSRVAFYDTGYDGGLATTTVTEADGTVHRPVAYIVKDGTGTLAATSRGLNPGSTDSRILHWTVAAGTLEASGDSYEHGLGSTAGGWILNGKTPTIAQQHFEGMIVKSGATLAWRGDQGFLASSVYGGAPKGDGFNPGEFVLESGATLRGTDAALNLGVQAGAETYLCYPTIKAAPGTHPTLTFGGTIDFRSGLELDTGVLAADVAVSGGNVKFSNNLTGAVGVDMMRTLTQQAGTVTLSNNHTVMEQTTVQPGSTMEMNPNGGTMDVGGNVTLDGVMNVRAGATTVAGVISSTVPGATYGPGLVAGRLAGAFDVTTANPANVTATGLGAMNTSYGANDGTIWIDNVTWVYTGEFQQTATGPVTFAENFDDGVFLKINGATILNNNSWNTPTMGTTTLAAGWYPFEARFGQGVSGVGPVNQGGQDFTGKGLGWDNLGRGAVTAANFTTIPDSLFRYFGFESGALTVDAGATMQATGFTNLYSVDVKGTMVTGTHTNSTKFLTIAGPTSAPTGVLDLTTGSLIIDYVDGSSPITQIAGWIKAGYNKDAGYWDGKGITSSVAATQDLDSNGEIDLLTAIGVADNMKWNPDLDEGLGGYEARFTEFGGVAVDMTSVLAKYTYWGDANLDGAVTFDDYDVIDYYYWFPLPPAEMGWWTGDFNMDGYVTFDDYDLIDYAYWFQGPQLSNGLNGVPEPATLALLGLGALAAIARRRRQA